MLKTSGSTESKIESGEGRVTVGGDRRAGRGRSGIDDSEVGGGEIEDDEVGKKAQKLSKSKNSSKSDFLTPGARLAFIELRQAFVKASILYHFDPKRHIQIKTNASGYIIDGVPSQLTSNDLGQSHPVAFFSQKIIPAATRYETHDSELLAIVETFKTWKHYLKRS